MALLSTTALASDIQLDYMKLLVTQLQNQDPLEPLDNNEMASQLTQFSQLNQLETMNQSFERALTFAERNYAGSLLGKEISFAAETRSGAIDIQNGIVDQVYHDTDGEIWLVIGNQTVRLEEVLLVKK